MINYEKEKQKVKELLEYFPIACPCCGKYIINYDLIDRLYKLENICNIKLKPLITSFYRCPIHNDAVGGIKNSYHIQGKACDIYTGTKEITDKFVNAAKLCGFKRIGWKRYKNIFIHIDVGERPSPAEW